MLFRSFEDGDSFGGSYLKYLLAESKWSKKGLEDECGRVILGDGTLRKQRYILGKSSVAEDEGMLRPAEVFRYIMPTSVLPLINTLRFNFERGEIYWDAYYAGEGLRYRLSKRDGYCGESIIYEGKETRAIDGDLRRGDVYCLEYIMEDGEGVMHHSRRAEVKADVEDEDRKSTRLNSSHIQKSRMPSSA